MHRHLIWKALSEPMAHTHPLPISLLVVLSVGSFISRGCPVAAPADRGLLCTKALLFVKKRNKRLASSSEIDIHIDYVYMDLSRLNKLRLWIFRPECCLFPRSALLQSLSPWPIVAVAVDEEVCISITDCVLVRILKSIVPLRRYSVKAKRAKTHR